MGFVSEETETFQVPDGALPWLDGKLAKLAKRAAKLGVDAPGYDIVATATKTDDETGIVTVTHELAMHGGVVKLAGWQLLAALDVTDCGDAGMLVLVRTLPGVELTDTERAAARTATGECDHCRARRQRKATYLVRGDNGQHAIVGSGCLADFTGHTSPEALAAWAQILLELEDGVRGGGWGLMLDPAIDQTFFLARIATAVDLWGWRPQSACYDGDVCTADRVWQATLGTSEQDKAAARELEDAVTGQHAQTAAAAIAYALNADENADDYRHNLAVACAAPITYRTKRIAASAVSSWLRQQERLALQQAERAAQLDEWYGAVGQRIELELQFISERSFEGQFGTTWLTIFSDAEGRRYKWWGKGLEGEPKLGETYRGKATVKGHEVFNERKETVLTRCVLHLMQ